MNKELKALDRIETFLKENCKHYKQDIGYIKQALQRLEAIDNTSPSEALEGLKHIKKYYVPQPCSAKTYDYLETIEQALLKAQEKEKVLKIIFEKYVDLNLLDCDDEVEEYNRHFGKGRQLTEEEFDLLKGMIK